MRAIATTLLLLGSSLALAPAADAASFTVTATNFAWTPAALSVAPGDSVTFALGEGTHAWERVDGTDACDLPCTRTFEAEGDIDYVCTFHPSMTGTITVAVPVSVAITTPAAGSHVSGLVRVEGAASHPTSDIRNVSVRIGGSLVSAQLLGSGTSVSWAADVPTESVANGAALVVAEAHTESGRAGSASVAVTVSNPPRIDLRLASLSAQQDALLSNVVSFALANDGNEPAPATRALGEAYYDGAWHAFGIVEIPSLAPGSSASASLTWTPEPLALGTFPVRVTVDPDGEVPDVDRGNNAAEGSAAFVTDALPGTMLP